MDGGSNEEDIREVIELRFRDIGLLEYVSAEPQIPSLIRPIGISSVDFLEMVLLHCLGTYGMFKTCVGVAAKSLLEMPKLLSTALPVGKSWKKLGTPLATYEGSVPRTLLT